MSIEQIGYCDRVSESAVQYAERLPVKKADFNEVDAHQKALKLVYEYNDHGFVIDVEEAKSHLGSSWIQSVSAEIKFGDEGYELLNRIAFTLRIVKKERLLVVGSLIDGADIWPPQRPTSSFSSFCYHAATGTEQARPIHAHHGFSDSSLSCGLTLSDVGSGRADSNLQTAGWLPKIAD